MRGDQFEAMYAAGPPWEIDRPQPDVERWADAGLFRGRVLDIGCGTGHNALLLARRGISVTAFDFAPSAVERAKRRLAAEPGLPVTFAVHDALAMATLPGPFDVALDSGTFHTLGDSARPTYVAGLSSALAPGGRLALLCFRPDEPGTLGPRRVSEDGLRSLFADGWHIESLEPTRYALADRPGWNFSPGGAHAWRLVARSSHDPHKPRLD